MNVLFGLPSLATIKASQRFSQKSVTHGGVNKASGKRREGYAGMKDPPLMFLRFEDAACAWRLGGRLGSKCSFIEERCILMETINPSTLKIFFLLSCTHPTPTHPPITS